MRPFALVVTLSALVAAAPIISPGDCKENIPDWVCKTWNLNCCNSAAYEGDRLPDSNPYSSVSATKWTDDSSSKVTFPGAGATSPKIQDIHAVPHDSTEQMSDIDCDDGEEGDDDTLEGDMLEEGDECDDLLDSENGNVPLTTVSEDEDCEEDFDLSDVKLDGSTSGLEDSEECKDEVEAEDSNDTFLEDIARIPVSATDKEVASPKVNVLAALGHEENDLDDLEYCDLDDDFQEEHLPFCDELDDLPSPSPATSTTTSHPPPTQAAPSAIPAPTGTAVPASKALTKKGPDTLPFADSQLSVSQGSSETDIDGTSDASKQVLEYHNQLRAMYGAAPLAWDPKLANMAHEHTRTCQWDHELPASRSYGSNIHKAYTSVPDASFSVHSTLDGYAEEFKDFDWASPRVSGDPMVGHLTQMVWKNTTRVGCAWRFDCDVQTLSGSNEFSTGIYSSCWYDPPGNVMDTAVISDNVGIYAGQ